MTVLNRLPQPPSPILPDSIVTKLSDVADDIGDAGKDVLTDIGDAAEDVKDDLMGETTETHTMNEPPVKTDRQQLVGPGRCRKVRFHVLS